MPKHKAEPPFPHVIPLRGRNYVWRSELERYKLLLTLHALGSRQAPPPPTERPEGDVLVPLKVASVELGGSRRTIGRRIKETTDAAATSDAAA